MKLLSAQQLRARLDERFKLLIGGGGTLARHQTLRASMQWSHELLPAPEQRMLRKLAVFAGGWTLEAATAICSTGDELETLELLTSLFDKSLLVVSRTEFDERRFGMLQTVRQYAQDELADPEERPLVQTRHLKHFVAWVEREISGPQTTLDALKVGRLRDEQANLRAAFEYGCSFTDGFPDALRLAGSLWPFWLATAQLEQGQKLLSRALALTDGTSSESLCAERARALLGLGNIEFYRGRYREALAAAEACLPLAHHAGAAVVVGFAHKLRAGGHHALGDGHLAIVDYQATLDIATECGELALQASALNNLGEVYRGLGNLSLAEQSYLRALSVGRESGALDKVAALLCNLARLFAMSGRLQHAVKALEEACDIAVRHALRRVGDDSIDIAAGLANIAGDHWSAARFYGASLARMEESGSRREPVDEAFLAPLIVLSRMDLGEQAFGLAQREGGALTYANAMLELQRSLLRWITP